MRNYLDAIVSFTNREDGPTAVEYAVILAFIVVVCLAGVAFIGFGTSDLFSAAGPGAGKTQ